MASACPVGVNPHVPGFPLWDRHRRQRVSVGSTSALPLRQGVPRLLPGVHPFALVSTLPFLAKRSRKTICNAGPRVAVIGAGPAGLASAVALRRECPDVDVMVYERSPELRPGVGGGVQLHSGAALLQDLGVDLNFAQAMRRIRSRAVDGSELLKLDLVKLLDSFKPFVGSVRRPNGEPASCTVMRDALLRAIADQLPVESISLGMELKDIQGVLERNVAFAFSLILEDFDLVIAADGIGSLARGVVLQEDEEPRYTGLRIQYGVREAGGRPTACEEEVHQWFGQGVYALTATYGGLDGKMFEMLAVVFRDDAPVAENPNWNPVEVKDNCLERLRAAGHRDEVLELAKSCSRFFELGVCERTLPGAVGAFIRDNFFRASTSCTPAAEPTAGWVDVVMQETPLDEEIATEKSFAMLEQVNGVEVDSALAFAVNLWLGFLVNPAGPIAQMAPEKREIVMNLLAAVADGQRFTKKEVEQMLTRLNWATNAIFLAHSFLQTIWTWFMSLESSGVPSRLRMIANLLMALFSTDYKQASPYNWWGASDASKCQQRR
ncbi:unnamed protein product [Durusdinium trenchii]|uniref:Uncharacterized protein n=1 Tax=Durusdinium trenchii TaxID=1381693 RepID=A0ABP0IDR2_9DINO